MKASASSSTATLHPPSRGSSITRPERASLDGPSRPLDPRIHAYRRDVADIALAGRLFAPHYAQPQICSVSAEAVMLRAGPSEAARAVSQLLHGEGFAVLDIAGGWAWGRCRHDDYVGYLPADALGRADEATHRVTVPVALVFTDADIKAPVVSRWSLGAVAAGKEQGDFVAVAEGFLHRRHVAPIGQAERDPVSAAMRLVGQPYLWGGRGAGGVDCSGLIQLALGACGIACPRDSDMQGAVLGYALPPDAPLERADLIFFTGHVGMMVDGERLLHANAFHMGVVIEPLADVVARLVPERAEPILNRRRLV